MTLVFKLNPNTKIKVQLQQQKNNYTFNSIVRMNLGNKNFGKKKIGCGCGK